MIVRYRYRIDGRNREGKTWFTDGEVWTEREGDFPAAVMEALRDSFMKVTAGKAVYGRPYDTCKGPYVITRATVERVEVEEMPLPEEETHASADPAH
jgi:hypothetical protein